MTTTRATPPIAAGEREGGGALAPSLASAAGLVGVVLAIVQLLIPSAVPADQFSTPFTPMVATIVAVALALQHLLLVPLMLLLVRVAAPTRLGRVGAAIASVGLVGLAVAELVAIAAAHERGDTPLVDAVNNGFSVPSILLGVGEVLLGVAVLRAGRWHGWARAIVLVAGIFMFVPLIPALAIGGTIALVALGVWSLLYIAIAVPAMRSVRHG